MRWGCHHTNLMFAEVLQAQLQVVCKCTCDRTYSFAACTAFGKCFPQEPNLLVRDAPWYLQAKDASVCAPIHWYKPSSSIKK